ncbi:MAG: cytochrome P450 [Hyphomicrobiales bacterium]|nr:cytochrome P450 [Hyphomicrobiales bacterium]
MNIHSRINPASSGAPFIPFTLKLRAGRTGRLAHLWYLSKNAIDIWTRGHFEELVVADRILIGESVLINDPAGIRRVLLDNVSNYEKDALQLRILNAGSKPDQAQGLLVATGEQWRIARRTLAPLFTPRRVAALARIMHTQGQARVQQWLALPAGSILPIDNEMSETAYDILSSTLFSGALEGNAKDVDREMSILLDSIGRIHPFDVLNAPAWLPRIGHGRGYRARRYFEAEMEKLLDTRLAIAESSADLPDDLLSALLHARDPETGQGLSRGEITSNLFTFVAAGHESTARALAWTLYLLSQAPAWEERCFDEASHAPEDPGQWLTAMPAIRAAFEEAMRLFPPVPQLSRIARDSDVVAGTTIAPGTYISITPWVLHRHRKLWDNPDAFMPERFMPGNRESIDRFAYLPFGGGPRVCIGQIFAMQEAVIVLACILQRLRLIHRGDPPVPMHRITLRSKKPILMAIEPRTLH